MQERQNKIISILQTRSSSIDLNILSGILKCSTRSVRNEIKEINDILDKISAPKIMIDRGKALPIDLNVDTLRKISKLQEKMSTQYLSPNERLVALILDFVNYPEQIKVYEEQEKLFISKSTMDQDMRRVRKFLEKFGLKLRTKEGVVVEGQEKNIRMMLQQLVVHESDVLVITQLSTLQYDFNSKIIRDFLGLSILKKVNSTYKENIDFKIYRSNTAIDAQIIFTISLWMKRVSNGYLLKDELQDLQWDLPANKIAKFISDLVLSMDMLVPRSEIRYIYYLVSGLLVKNTSDMEIWSRAQIITLQLISYMSDQEQVNYQKSERLFEQLNLHMVAFEQRRKKGIEIYNPLSSVLKEGYPQIFEDVTKFMDENFGKKISVDEIAYITVYFSTYYEKSNIENKYYRVAILCNYGLATGHLLAANIKKNFDVEIVSVLGIAEQKKLKNLNLDFVVKTIDVPLSLPSIKVPPIMLTEDFKMLEAFMRTITPKTGTYESKRFSQNIIKDIVNITENDLRTNVSNDYIDDLIRILNNHHISVNESEVRPMIDTLLTDDKIQLQVNAETWKEAIEKSAEPLLKNHAITNNYVKAMIKSVIQYGAYIVIGPGLALAHARPEEGAKELGISVLSLAKPVNFGSETNDPVRLVFCLAAIDNYSHLNVMRSIVSLLNQPNKIDNLGKLNDKEEFKKILFSK